MHAASRVQDRRHPGRRDELLLGGPEANGLLESEVRPEIHGREKQVTAILKTLPTRFARGQLERFLGAFTAYYFSLGRGRPKTPPAQLWFTHSGILIGFFEIQEIVRNAGDLRDGAKNTGSMELPKLTTLDGGKSAWQIPPGNWVAVCRPPFCKLEDRVYHEGFRGWRYFDLESYRGTVGAKVRI
jgi:hypothetical protein